ncbi:MAG: hypothetical protein KAS78_06335 [Candidatus Pacebacteria bacterium]|nr:hypothetical protein [Candidatus Paceibacterota bacterium]
MTKEQKERYGMCHDMAQKFAEENEAALYTSSNNIHSIAIKYGKSI